MNEEEVKSLIETFKEFEVNEKKSFIEAFANLGGFYVDIKDLEINTKVTYRKNKDGEYKAKIDIPNEWLDRLGVTRYDSNITIKLSQDNITIRKYEEEIDDLDFDDLDFDDSDFDDSEYIEEMSSEETVQSLLIDNSYKKTIAKNLIEKGRSNGYLKLSELMEAFSADTLDREQVKNLYDVLGKLGIEVIQDIDTVE